jgi:ribosomal protein S18 acetylase RimI-like enzyme
MPQLDFRIQWVGDTELASIREINRHFSETNSQDESLFTEALASKRVLLATRDSVAAGYLLYQLLWGSTPFIALLRVVPHLRRTGLGKRLVSMTEKRLKREGYQAVISSSEEANLPANEFHAKIGFERIGVLPMIFGSEIFYKKHL